MRAILQRDHRRRAHMYGLMAVIMLLFAWVSNIAAQETVGDPLDLTNLPIGDGKLSDTPLVGYVCRCGSGMASGIGGTEVDGPGFVPMVRSTSQ